MKKSLPLLTAWTLFLLLPCAAAYAQSNRGEFTIAFGPNGVDQPRHAEAGSAKVRVPVNFRLQLTDKYKLIFGIDYETFLAKRGSGGQWAKGTGNVVLLIRSQFVTEEAELSRPTVRLTYSVTLPTASVEKGLGTGRVDHKILGTLTRRVKMDDVNGRNTMAVDFGVNFAGRQGQSGFKKAGLLNLSMERALDATKKYTLHGEVDMVSRADTSPSQIYTTNYLKVTVSKRVKVKVGFIAGITPTYARAGGYGSIEFAGPKLWR
jgi:hypothetical protein